MIADANSRGVDLATVDNTDGVGHRWTADIVAVVQGADIGQHRTAVDPVAIHAQQVARRAAGRIGNGKSETVQIPNRVRTGHTATDNDDLVVGATNARVVGAIEEIATVGQNERVTDSVNSQNPIRQAGATTDATTVHNHHVAGAQTAANGDRVVLEIPRAAGENRDSVVGRATAEGQRRARDVAVGDGQCVKVGTGGVADVDRAEIGQRSAVDDQDIAGRLAGADGEALDGVAPDGAGQNGQGVVRGVVANRATGVQGKDLVAERQRVQARAGGGADVQRTNAIQQQGSLAGGIGQIQTGAAATHRDATNIGHHAAENLQLVVRRIDVAANGQHTAQQVPQRAVVNAHGIV